MRIHEYFQFVLCLRFVLFWSVLYRRFHHIEDLGWRNFIERVFFIQKLIIGGSTVFEVKRTNPPTTFVSQ